MKTRNLFAATGLALLAMTLSAAGFAETHAKIDTESKAALAKFYAMNPQHKKLEARAAGMLVFPEVTKAGAGVAGEHGNGLLMVHGKTVGYYSTSSASVGLTVGVSHRSEVIMFMTQKALDDFMASKGWSVGAETGLAVAKNGGGGDYDSDTLKKSIIGFVFSEKGLMADVSLEGSKITKI